MMVKFVNTANAGTDADKYDRTGVSFNFEFKIGELTANKIQIKEAGHRAAANDIMNKIFDVQKERPIIANKL